MRTLCPPTGGPAHGCGERVWHGGDAPHQDARLHQSPGGWWRRVEGFGISGRATRSKLRGGGQRW